MELTNHFIVISDKFYKNNEDELNSIKYDPLSEELEFMAFCQTKGRFLFNPNNDLNAATKIAAFKLYVPKNYGVFNNENIVNNKSKVKNKKLELLTYDDYTVNRVVKVKDVIAYSKHLILSDYLNTLIKYEYIFDDTYILLKRNQSESWEKNIPTNMQFTASGYFWKPEQESIHITELINVTATVELNYDKYYKIKAMLEQKDTYAFGLQLLNECNIVKNPIQTMLLLNRCQLNKKENYSLYKKNLKLKSVFPEVNYSLDLIQNRAEALLQRTLNAEEKEFIADEYHTSNIETSKLFKFQLKVK